MKGREEMVEFGFLKGLADETKVRLADEGWNVVEYVPFGKESLAYVARRMVYLERLKSIGTGPAPWDLKSSVSSHIHLSATTSP